MHIFGTTVMKVAVHIIFETDEYRSSMQFLCQGTRDILDQNFVYSAKFNKICIKGNFLSFRNLYNYTKGQGKQGNRLIDVYTLFHNLSTHMGYICLT